MEHPFQRWIDAARPRTQLWRTALGAVIIVVVWMVWTTGSWRRVRSVSG